MKIVYIVITLSLIGYVFQLLTGIWLFIEKYGVEFESITSYILGGESTQPKSLKGVLEILIPHILSIPLFSFVLIHFLYYFPINQKLIWIGVFIFILGIAETVSSLLILEFGKVFSYVKLFSFIGYETGVFLVILFILLLFPKFHKL